MKESLRLDKFLVYCRIARTRSRAQALIEQGLTRINGARAVRGHTPVTPGDVLTLVLGDDVRLIAVETLPDRRGPPGKARLHYRELDRAQ